MNRDIIELQQAVSAQPRFGEALAEWQRLLGAENVVTEPAELRAAERSTFLTEQRVPAILRPGSTGEVQECMRVANRFRVPVYPISSGRNWGYGSRVPTCRSCALMELRRMNRILDFSEKLAYVTVEPGVTQGQLQVFLEEKRSHLWMDSSGAGPECSIVGNTMERGFGHTPYGDHFANVCGLEVVLPTGERLETGFARFPGAQTGPLNRWGFGPSVDGLFSQSNLGVVTRMTSWLMPAPEYFQAYFFRCDEEEGLAPLIDAFRPLRLDGTIRSAVHIGNDYKILSALRQYPWRETGGQTPLTPEMMKRLAGELNIGRWNGSGALYGTRAQVAEARRLIRKALKGKVRRLQFLDDRTVRLASWLARPCEWITGWDVSRILEMLRPVYGLMKGVPTSHPIASTYWRKRTPPPGDPNPDRDGCGLLWCSPVAPAEGGHAVAVMAIANDTLLRHGFEPIVSITLLTERTICLVISITYDRDAQGEDHRALICHRELVTKLSEAGYYPYRLGLQSMSEMNRGGGYLHLLRKLKGALDPESVLAPGRYEPV